MILSQLLFPLCLFSRNVTGLGTTAPQTLSESTPQGRALLGGSEQRSGLWGRTDPSCRFSPSRQEVRKPMGGGGWGGGALSES